MDQSENSCPFGGDTANDCEGCVYSIDYYYDSKSSDCVAREG